MAWVDTTSGKRKHLWQIMFEKHDTNRNGNIDARELKALCYDRGYYLSEEELAVAFTELDVDGEGEIGADEFSKWWRTSDRFGSLQLTEAQQAAVSHLTTYFRYFDDDNSGCLNTTEFAGLYKNLVDSGYELDPIEEVVAAIDTSGEGNVHFNEYIKWLVSLGALDVAGGAAEPDGYEYADEEADDAAAADSVDDV